VTTQTPGDRLRDDLLSALTNLGYHRHAIDKVLDRHFSTDGDRTFEDLLRSSLKELSRS
jgi:Holliday junction resolvasome RuvABC DNA-binding subunit